MKPVALFCTLFLYTLVQAQVPKVSHLQNVLEQTSPAMSMVKLVNKSFPINTEGGHLQGIQYFETNGKRYLVVSGSSSTVSYYAVAELQEDGQTAKVVRYKELLPYPYKHAGGFQMHGTLMAIGIEDNELKNRSKVLLFDLSEPGVTDNEPLYIIEREGEEKVMTAGAVGITEHDGQYLLLVSGWDSKYMDFYRSSTTNTDSPNFKFAKVAEWNVRTADRSDWYERWFNSYQNLNLVLDDNDSIWIAGLYKDKDGNYVDLYHVTFDSELKEAHLVKTYSKQFYCAKGPNFRNGGGLYLKSADEIAVMAVSKNLKSKAKINWFPVKRVNKK